MGLCRYGRLLGAACTPTDTGKLKTNCEVGETAEPTAEAALASKTHQRRQTERSPLS